MIKDLNGGWTNKWKAHAWARLEFSTSDVSFGRPPDSNRSKDVHRLNSSPETLLYATFPPPLPSRLRPGPPQELQTQMCFFSILLNFLPAHPYFTSPDSKWRRAQRSWTWTQGRSGQGAWVRMRRSPVVAHSSLVNLTTHLRPSSSFQEAKLLRGKKACPGRLTSDSLWHWEINSLKFSLENHCEI